MPSTYTWTLTYDDGSTERVRASSPARGVQRRTALELPVLVSSRTLVRAMGTRPVDRFPLRSRLMGHGFDGVAPVPAPAVLRPEARVYPAQYRAIGYEPETARQEGW